MPPALEAQSLNHWTTWEVPLPDSFCLYFVLAFFLICIKVPLSFYTAVHGVLTGKYTEVVCLLTDAMDMNLG